MLFICLKIITAQYKFLIFSHFDYLHYRQKKKYLRNNFKFQIDMPDFTGNSFRPNFENYQNFEYV